MAVNAAIGRHGLALLQAVAARGGAPVNVLTHCNAGWLATVDWGTATSLLYQAHRRRHGAVRVDETRPRNQGASLTAWELGHEGVPHTVIADNAGGHYLQHGQVDLVIVGCDRVACRGDVCNKIGTHLKGAGRARQRRAVHAAMPASTLDPAARRSWLRSPIEERSAREVTHLGRPHGGARGRGAWWWPAAARPPTRRSTSRRRAWSAA